MIRKLQRREKVNLPARFVIAFDNAKAEETPFPPPDISSPRSSLANLSFICSISESNPRRKQKSYEFPKSNKCKQ
jgi:hypothetical protein